jgi:hypothetical protein
LKRCHEKKKREKRLIAVSGKCWKKLVLRQSSCDLHLMAMPCALHAWAYSANDVHKHSQSPPISHPQESNTHLLSKKKNTHKLVVFLFPPEIVQLFFLFLK